MSAVAIRWLVLAIVVAAAAAGGWQAGSAHVYGKWLTEKDAQAAAAVKIVTRQGEVTERVVTRYRDRVEVRKGIDTTIEKEVVKYVESKPLALACRLDGEWVRLHDAAAAGAIPPTAGRPDAGSRAPEAASARSANGG